MEHNYGTPPSAGACYTCGEPYPPQKSCMARRLELEGAAKNPPYPFCRSKYRDECIATGRCQSNLKEGYACND